MPHHCHALACTVEVPPRLLMCRKHWALVCKAAQAAVYQQYVPGQERTKVTTAAYRQAAARAIILVAQQEGQRIPSVYHQMAQGED